MGISIGGTEAQVVPGTCATVIKLSGVRLRRRTGRIEGKDNREPAVDMWTGVLQGTNLIVTIGCGYRVPSS